MCPLLSQASTSVRDSSLSASWLSSIPSSSSSFTEADAFISWYHSWTGLSLQFL
eukprot:CAMPEP_0171291146 /NCGR_PEP_ID=MMETSP0790-20130122/71504_1 /TAXON_ID=2925 /ORGANISM="Alexandrium catenella, Strain OF101" /LENGTH=53 /DNA_ID=CAMNT_0011760865 /DNA_START=24 /DNA_END=185 /DNA_ORIENTATION=+